MVMHAGADSIFADRRLVITIVTFAIILPLCFPRELGALAWVSMAAVRLALLSACQPMLHSCWELGAAARSNTVQAAQLQAEHLSRSRPALTQGVD